MTVLNAAYLGLMAKFESAKDFGTAFIPLILKLVFPALDGKTRNRNNTLLLMGKSQTDQLEFPSTATLAFGSWINSNHPDPLQNVAFGPLKRNYSLQEMSGLYGALMDSTFLPFTNTSLLARCTNKNNPPSRDCGLAINLGIYATFNASSFVKSLVAPWIQSFLCLHASSCYNTTSNPAAILAVAAFIAGPLPRFVLQYLKNNTDYGLTTTRNQSEIILGYSSLVPVPGSVTSYNNEAEAKAQEKSSTFYTCEFTERRFTYAGKGWGKRGTGGRSAV